MKANETLGIIFSNMHDEFLRELTASRTMGSVPFGGRYRLVDFALSNMVNANISQVGIITKSNYQSLMDHLSSGKPWDLARKIGGLHILPPYGMSGAGIYSGKVDALYNIMSYLEYSNSELVVMCDSDVVCNIDVSEMMRQHVTAKADVTCAFKRETMPQNTSDYVTYRVEETGRIFDIEVAPESSGVVCCHALNIYVFNRDFLIKIIKEAYSHNKKDLEKDVFMGKLAHNRFNGYEVKGFAQSIGSMQSYLKTNMALLNPEVRRDLFNPRRPVFTKTRDDMPARYGLESHVSNSLIADGCVIEGEVTNCLIFRGVKIGKGTVVKDSILMQGTTIGDNAKLSYVTTDKNVTIKDGRNLMGFETYPVYISKGTVV